MVRAFLNLCMKRSNGISNLRAFHPATTVLFIRSSSSKASDSVVTKPVTEIPKERVLLYTGPMAEQIRRFKTVALMFSMCAVIAVPSVLLFGKAPMLGAAMAGTSALTPSVFIHWLTKNYVYNIWLYAPSSVTKHLAKHLNNPQRDFLLGLETFSYIGKGSETLVYLSQLAHARGKYRYVTWINRDGRKDTTKRFFVEKDIFANDAQLKALWERIEKQTAPPQIGEKV
ncbi:uncharacterized protein VTP21DRAFT_6061 [Calcarisporiella thermophila]|uniref:uncharacterized protein n=1 Tax=Calcarisporiella thermophila TaxID=911321 RepID=UPI003742A35F